MELLVGSVWRVTETSEKFRIISLSFNTPVVVAFPLPDDRKKICKPFALHVDEISNKIQMFQIVKDHFPTPGIMLQAEESISKKDIALRDQRYKYIDELVCDSDFVHEYCLSDRSKLVTQHAKKNGYDLRAVYRALRDYWRYGLSKNALIPLRNHQGARGKDRPEGTEKKGRPTKSSVFGFNFATGINITTSDKTKIQDGYREYYATGKSKTLSSAYQDTLNSYYANEIRQAASGDIFPLVPSMSQFKYWGEKRVGKIEVNVGRNPKGDFERNQRGLTESMHSSASFPGKVFEIDATTADVHIVSPLNRTMNLGRPTIYSVVDRASRMIAGLYVSLGHPSWEVARLALLHTFSSKVNHAKRYGVEITEADWPCYHLPETLIGDRGELNGKTPGSVIPTTGIILDIAPAYRPDMKGIVESRFGIFNDESLHELPGTTKGKPRERGEIDPRELAILTLDEITNILIRDVLKHNNTHTFDDLATSDLIKANLDATANVDDLLAQFEVFENFCLTPLSLEHIADTNNISLDKNTMMAIHNDFEREVNVVINTVMAGKEKLQQLLADRERQISQTDWYSSNQTIASEFAGISEDYIAKGENFDPNTYQEWLDNRDVLREQLDLIDDAKLKLNESIALKKKIITKLFVMRRRLQRKRQSFIKNILGDNRYVKMTLKPFLDTDLLESEFREILGLSSDNFSSSIYQEGSNESLLSEVFKTTASVKVKINAVSKVKNAVLKMAEEGVVPEGFKIDARLITQLTTKMEVRPDIFDRLDWWWPEDKLVVQYAKDPSRQNFENLEKGSAGQKAAAILAFLLSHGEDPIIVDQPEDDLDNALIYQLIVAELHKNKKRRQIIMVTHNPNIVVNGDAEMVNVLEYKGGQVVVADYGSLCDLQIRDQICNIMEGGKEAFEKRYKRIVLN